ncbi:hypothetical protein MIN45_P2175 [Methylomarinovum tepidoasis]|uniref:Sulfotransferase n=1 Tax=Methylomarinovum tepidoasis TaxID=2840183 RepID=A0AAU9C805_9GAMM|nr:sulfotransferase [Methylomarinovum sp. IN45]BCX89802.1 hypothetical protein MIN45_P2175 [Methylomarinovum sp. IN45]
MFDVQDLAEKVHKTLHHYLESVRRSIRAGRFDLRPRLIERPVFIVGCSRAGTTLVYKTFSESSRLASLQRETHDFWARLHPPAERNWDSHVIPPQYANDRDRQALARLFFIRCGRCDRIVDKNNQNGLSIPYLLALFPQAHFVFVKRNPGDNIQSLIRGWGKAEEFGDWAAALPVEVAVDGGRYRRWCFFLPPGWRDYTHSSIEEVCAFQYAAMNEAIVDARRLVPKAQWHEIAYESILEDPSATFQSLFEACGLPFDARLQRHCQQVLQRPYNAFSRIGTDKWRQSEDRQRIERVLPGLETVATRLGYQLG